MAQVKRHLADLGVPSQQCHYEFFGPAAALDARDDGPARNASAEDRDERSVRLSTAGAADRSRAAGGRPGAARRRRDRRYFLDRYLNMPALVFSHALVIPPALLKIGCVMRLRRAVPHASTRLGGLLCKCLIVPG